MRAEEEFDLPDQMPSTLAACLTEHCQIPEETAHKLVWGESSNISKEEVDRIAVVFALEQELLALLLLPTSPEIMLHIVQSYQEELDVENCEACEYFTEIIQRLEEDDVFVMQHISIDLLEHLCFNDGLPWDDMEDFETNFQKTETMQQLDATMADLPAHLQEKVLAFAVAQATEHEYQALMQFSNLREHLSALSIEVFNVLCYEEEGLDRSQLQSKLKLANARSLGQIPRSVNKAIASMTKPITEHPLIIDDSGHMSLSDQARQSWQKLIATETSR